MANIPDVGLLELGDFHSMPYQEVYYTSLDGLRLYARDFGGGGDKPVVLCLPGLTRNSADFEDLAAHLSADFRVLCPDQRGRGKSQYASDSATYAPPVYVGDMIALLDHLGVDKTIIIGTSLGGLMAMLMAAMGHKDRLRGVVLNDIGPVFDPQGIAHIMTYVGKNPQYSTWEEAAMALKALGKAAFPTYGNDDWLNFAHKTCVEKEGRITTNYDPRIAEPFTAEGDAPAPDLWPAFEALKGLPLLCLRGETSNILAIDTLHEMQKRIPDMEVSVVPERGHAPTLDEAEARHAIDRFLSPFKS